MVLALGGKADSPFAIIERAREHHHGKQGKSGRRWCLFFFRSDLLPSADAREDQTAQPFLFFFFLI
jgi:hypothetical protein